LSSTDGPLLSAGEVEILSLAIAGESNQGYRPHLPSGGDARPGAASSAVVIGNISSIITSTGYNGLSV
jgi:hypothetical protein